MARKAATKTKKTTTRRGSPEAIQKRRTARQLNSLLTDGPSAGGIDRRTERRRRRLLAELAKGRGGEALKPITVLTHADELLAINTPFAEVKKSAGRKYKASEVTEEILETALRAQAAYEFDARVWSLLGIDLATAKTPKRGRSKSRA